jgi:predicted metalloprotease with PDZ domain
MVRSFSLALAVLAATSTAVSAQVPVSRDIPYPGAITLMVDTTDIDHRVMRIHERLPVTKGRVTLLYPQWIPGHHGPTNLVKRLAGLRFSADGRPLAWTRDADNLYAFHVEVPAGVTTLDVEFQQLLKRDPDGDMGTLTDAFVAVEWQGVVLAPAGWAVSRVPVDASLRLPSGWHQGSALRPKTTTIDSVDYERVSLETLVDSPVYAARYYRQIPLDPPGTDKPAFLDLFADHPESLAATDAQIETHANVVHQAERAFGSRHWAHFDFLLALTDENMRLGLEHHQSSENSASGKYFTDWDHSTGERYLIPHEFTHSWDGKFRRPKDLWAPDFNTPTGNTLLWVYEGQTQYWGEVIATRAGMYTAEEYRERLAEDAARLQADPGRRWRPLQDTVHDEIIAGREAPRDWGNWSRFEPYYDEGALLWFDVDTRIRELSGDQRSLDDFARAFFGVDDGRITPLLYTAEDVYAQLNRIQPYDWAGFFSSHLDNLTEAPLDGLARSGWRLGWTDKESDYRKRNRPPGRRGSSYAYSLGFSVGDDGGLRGVTWNGPAFKQGLGEDATLVAVDSHEFSIDTLDAAIRRAEHGTQPIALLFKIGKEYRTIDIDYHGGIRYPELQRIEGTPDRLSRILTAR